MLLVSKRLIKWCYYQMAWTARLGFPRPHSCLYPSSIAERLTTLLALVGGAKALPLAKQQDEPELRVVRITVAAADAGSRPFTRLLRQSRRQGGQEITGYVQSRITMTARETPVRRGKKKAGSTGPQATADSCDSFILQAACMKNSVIGQRGVTVCGVSVGGGALGSQPTAGSRRH